MNRNLLVFLLCFFPFFHMNAATLTVPGDYATIQLAVNAASPDDEILVADGTYNESVNLNTMGTPGNLTLRAVNAGLAVVNGGAGAAFIASAYTGNITIDGFTLDRDAPCACPSNGVLDFSNVTGLVALQNNTFDPAHGANSIFLLANGTTVMSALVDNNTGAIVIGGDNYDFLRADADGTATLNLVASNNVFTGLEDDAIALTVDGSSAVTATIIDNSFTAFSATGGGMELFAGRSGSSGASLNATVERNTISGTTSGDGIYMNLHGTNTIAIVTIRNNTLTGNTGDGIDIATTSSISGVDLKAVIEDNTVNGNTGMGIRVEGETDPGNTASIYYVVIDNNNLDNNGADPSVLVDGDDTADPNMTMILDIRNNTVTNPNGNAYQLQQSSSTVFNLEQGASASTTPATVLADNANTGTPINIIGTINVAANALNDNHIPGNAGNFIWNDVNADGDQDVGEPGISGVTVSIAGTQAIGGAISRTTVSDSDGEYAFGALLPGTYTITVTLSPLFSFFSPRDVGGNDLLDSDFDISSGQAALTFVAGAGSDISLDAGMNNTPLPIELTDFNATAMEKAILLEWKTSAEFENTGFEIERKSAGHDFQQIKWIDGKGNSNSGHEYHFTDTEAVASISYFYRLKQIDVNGNFHYSNVVEASLKEIIFPRLYPNPLAETLFIRNAGEGGEVKIIDMTGRIVLKAILTSTNENLNISHLAEGHYIVYVTDGKGNLTRMLMGK